MVKKEIPSILLIFVLFLVLIFVLFSSSNPSGAFSYEVVEESVCFDTDGGVDIYKRGAIYTGDGGYSKDYCLNGNQLKELSCKNGVEIKDYIDCPVNLVCDQGECVSSENVFICGNGVCENQREIDQGCQFDCDLPCKGEYCDSNVEVYCACDSLEFKAYKEGSPCTTNVFCEDCNKQEALFGDFHAMQSQVQNCLEEYFNYSSSRISNFVVYDSGAAYCDNPTDCWGYHTGKSTNYGVFWKQLQGSRNYGENQPTEPEHLEADKHETTHQILRQMLHKIPSWFHEAIAIQTTERISCHSSEDEYGDAYLGENFGIYGEDSGVILQKDPNKIYLDEDYYLSMKNGSADLSLLSLPPQGIEDSTYESHHQGILWDLALKVEYNCMEDCISEIVQELRKKVELDCQISQEACGVSSDYTFITGESTCPYELGSNGVTGDFVFNIKKIPEKQSIISNKEITPVKNQILERMRFWRKENVPEKVKLEKNYEYWEGWSPGIFNIDNTDIKEATDKVIGQDTSEMWDLIGLPY